MGCGSPPRTFAAHGAQNNAEPNASSLRTETETGAAPQKEQRGQSTPAPA